MRMGRPRMRSLPATDDNGRLFAGRSNYDATKLTPQR